MKRRIIAGILLLSVVPALGVAITVRELHWDVRNFVSIFVGVLIGYWIFAVSLVFPAVRGRKLDYLQTILLPLIGELCFYAMYSYNKDIRVDGWEGVGQLFVSFELMVITPALILSITSFCTIFKKSALRIGLPVAVLVCHIVFSWFALSADYHDAEKWFLVIPFELLPTGGLALYMTVSLFLWCWNDR